MLHSDCSPPAEVVHWAGTVCLSKQKTKAEHLINLVMQSLTREIQSFSRTRLRKQCTRVTSLSGRRIIETWKGSTITVVEDPVPPEKMLGYVPDTSWDLQVGIVKPFLLLGSQDAAHDFGILRKHKVSRSGQVTHYQRLFGYV
ncbi:hypothetical protein ATANTOWER_004406 [Ataeniobius toweri]|uniref:Uncharacterized protein n=1 Tax=Ataeniobius toweri TaxID=208326 RepID=A0ABU7C2Y0_9TELE|nr:hypothetical protein [Ataeniobius toweri]